MKILEHFLRVDIQYSQKNDIYKNSIFLELGYKILSINTQINSINGLLKKQGQLYFFKIVKHDWNSEILGYIYTSQIFPVSEIKSIITFKDCVAIIFLYDESIGKDTGLLNDYIVDNEINKKCDCSKAEEIVNIYRRSFKKTIVKKRYPMMKFFNDRVDSRLKQWYKNEKLFNYDVKVNGIITVSTYTIIQETIEYFSKNHSYICAVTQGDPNVLNIAVKPVWFDYNTAGYNAIVAEFSAFLWSELIADMYFCPKYHKESYLNHEKIYYIVNQYRNKISYNIDNDKKSIDIQCSIVTSPIRKKIIKEYILMLRELNIEIKHEIIYFLVMRILCIFNLVDMSRDDYFYSLAILHIFYNNINETDALGSIEEIVNNLENLY